MLDATIFFLFLLLFLRSLMAGRRREKKVVGTADGTKLPICHQGKRRKKLGQEEEEAKLLSDAASFPFFYRYFVL